MHEYIIKELPASHCVILIILHFNDSFLITNFSQPHGLNFSVETAFKDDTSYCSPDHDIKELPASHCVILIILHVNDSFLITHFSQPHGLKSVETFFKGDMSYCSPDHDFVNTYVLSTFVIIDRS